MKKYFAPVLIAVLVYYARNIYRESSIVIKKEQLLVSYDYVIVGAGMAGSVVASRLSELPNVTILVLEAGSEDGTHPDSAWNFLTEPQEKCCGGSPNRVIVWPRPKGLRRVSSSDDGGYSPGSKFDFDFWEKGLGADSGWGFEDVLPYFKKLENATKVKKTSVELNPLTSAIAELAKKLGVDLLDGEDKQEGFIPLNTIDTHLIPSVHQHPNRLHVLLNAHVTRLLIDDSEPQFLPMVAGVEFSHQGATLQATASRDVILTGGPVSTPQLLMLSGVGPYQDLQKLGIYVLMNNEAVGQYLHDQVSIPIFATVNSSGAESRNFFHSLKTRLLYYLFGKDILENSSTELSALIHSGISNESWPDLHLKFRFHLESQTPNRYGITVLPILLHPRTAGEIRLRTSNPFDQPIIDPKYLQNDTDIETVVAGLKIALEILQSPELQQFDLRISENHAPGCENFELWSTEYLWCHVWSLVATTGNAAGTCRMGNDSKRSVVDTQLRLHGFDRIRIVDSSIFPSQISSSSKSAVLMVAEKASDIIKNAYFVDTNPEKDRDTGESGVPLPSEKYVGQAGGAFVDGEDEDEEGADDEEDEDDDEFDEDGEEDSGEDTGGPVEKTAPEGSPQILHSKVEPES